MLDELVTVSLVQQLIISAMIILLLLLIIMSFQPGAPCQSLTAQTDVLTTFCVCPFLNSPGTYLPMIENYSVITMTMCFFSLQTLCAVDFRRH